jgi:hypothetical protein
MHLIAPPANADDRNLSACRQIAWRRRHTSATVIDTPPAASRRENTIYECAECVARYLG